jgi:hypothetical protein
MPRRITARRRAGTNPLSTILRGQQRSFSDEELARLFAQVDRGRIESLSRRIADYLGTNLTAVIERRDGLADYRTNPYVLMTSAHVMRHHDPVKLAKFLFDIKLYMSLETSFGKSMESVLVDGYPVGYDPDVLWTSPPEKTAEAGELVGFGRENRARLRNVSVWREIDKSCVIGNRRYLTSVKSGPNCINDTQVEAMRAAIANNHQTWLRQTRQTYPQVEELDIVVGITYGTDRTTNNKENQILIKLLESGFVEEDRDGRPGVLIHDATRRTRVYRRIGKDFWSFIGDPASPVGADYVFLEVLLGLSKGLTLMVQEAAIEDRINMRLAALSEAFARLMLPRGSLPAWVLEGFSENELFWFATAISSFYDEGI